MDQEKFIVYGGIEVPESPLLKVERKNKYGSVPGLDDEELASPAELERQIIWEQWGPVLLLPAPKNEAMFRPELDEDGYVVGAFASADFDRIKPVFDKARYKADKLREEVKNVLLMFGLVRQRLPRKAVAIVLKNLRLGRIKVDDISNVEMWLLGRYFLRVRRLQQEIVRLEEYSQRQRRKKAEKFLASLG
jgi:hypothetical protein